MSQVTLAKIFELSRDLSAKASKRGVEIATAESCTGGLIGAAITSSPGSSKIFRGSIVAYHNDVKINQLGVEPEAILAYGAVSEIVAEQMARGCRTKLNVDIAISVTGIAGPSGGSEDKPVGTIWFGIATKNSIQTKQYDFPNLSRNKVRDAACLAAMELFLAALD